MLEFHGRCNASRSSGTICNRALTTQPSSAIMPHHFSQTRDRRTEFVVVYLDLGLLNEDGVGFLGRVGRAVQVLRQNTELILLSFQQPPHYKVHTAVQSNSLFSGWFHVGWTGPSCLHLSELEHDQTKFLTWNPRCNTLHGMGTGLSTFGPGGQRVRSTPWGGLQPRGPCESPLADVHQSTCATKYASLAASGRPNSTTSSTRLSEPRVSVSRWRTCQRREVRRSADDPGAAAPGLTLALLDEVTRDDGAAVVRRDLPRQPHRLLRDLRDLRLPRRGVGPVCKHMEEASQSH